MYVPGRCKKKKCWQSFYYKNTIYYKKNTSAAD